MQNLNAQIQIRVLCPDWVKQKQQDPNTSVGSHQGACKQNDCGFAKGDFYNYKFVGLDELKVMMAGESAADNVETAVDMMGEKGAIDATQAPKRRGRKPKAEQAPAVAEADTDDILGADFDADLLGTSDEEDLLG